MTEREKMLLGEQFEMLDPQLSEDRRRAAALLGRLNALSMDASGYRDTLGELLPHASDECLIRPPFYCDYGYSLFIGRGVFINFNCVMLDGAPIRIGDHVLIGPAVQIYTFTHPMDFEQRRRPVESCRPVAIGDDCWIGGGAILCPGVRIGNGAIIGAGSVVTRDIPANSVAVGNPARVTRTLSHT